MRRLAGLFLVAAFILLGQGCGLIPSQDRNLEQRVDAWVAEHEYAKALNALGKPDKSNPQYAQLQTKKREVEQAAKKYEQAQLAIISQNIAKQAWAPAEQGFKQLMQQVPQNETLQAGYQDFVKKRSRFIQTLNDQLAINKAQWLIQDADVRADLASAMPDDKAAQRALQEHQAQANDVYQQLTACGNKAIEVSDLELAIECLQLANDLQPSAALQSSLADLQKKLDKEQRSTTQVISSHGKQLLTKAELKMREGNLKEAIALYEKISAKDKQYTQVIAFKKELDKHIKTNVKQGIELGRKLYSQGEVKQALAVWNNILVLDTNNQYLISYIKRAERVLQKLEKLQQEGTTIKPPEAKQPNS